MNKLIAIFAILLAPLLFLAGCIDFDTGPEIVDTSTYNASVRKSQISSSYASTLGLKLGDKLDFELDFKGARPFWIKFSCTLLDADRRFGSSSKSLTNLAITCHDFSASSEDVPPTVLFVSNWGDSIGNFIAKYMTERISSADFVRSMKDELVFRNLSLDLGLVVGLQPKEGEFSLRSFFPDSGYNKDDISTVSIKMRKVP